MLEIFILLALAIQMAKHGGRKPSKRRYNLRRVRITPELALSTLGSDTVITVALTGASTIAYRCVTVKGTWNLSNLTGGQGPITVGYAHSNYTVTEIKECLESAASISPGLKIEEEQANRLVRIVGTFEATGTASLNDGRPIKTRLNWLIPASASGTHVVMFAYNEGTSAISGGARLNHTGDMYIKDVV